MIKLMKRLRFDELSMEMGWIQRKNDAGVGLGGGVEREMEKSGRRWVFMRTLGAVLMR
jgi:hypothetical protein